MWAGSILAGAGVAFRQWRHPREFRIRSTAWPEDALAAFADLAGAGDTKSADPESDVAGLSGRSVAEVATSIWRLRAKIAASKEEPPRALVRHLETAWDVLAEAGVEIQDHLNAPFDSGLSLTVVAFQPTPGLGREQVIETIRPSIYLHGHTIQMGEVIVGTPDPPLDLPAFGSKESRTL